MEIRSLMACSAATCLSKAFTGKGQVLEAWGFLTASRLQRGLQSSGQMGYRGVTCYPLSARQLTQFLSLKAFASWPGQPGLTPLCYVTIGKPLNFSKNLPNLNSIQD